jgi:hypothetical protein
MTTTARRTAPHRQPPLITVVLDLATRVTCQHEDGQLPALVIDTSHTRILITAAAATLPHLSAPADLAEAAELFRTRLAAHGRRWR